jgi:Ca-activated chloride channel family protein
VRGGAALGLISILAASFAQETTRVFIPVAVTDPKMRFVTGLRKENFKVFENETEQPITQFTREDAPLSVGIVFDTSGSMGNKIRKSREAVAEFLKTANPADEFFLVCFNDTPHLAVSLTPGFEEIQKRLAFTHAKGHTALLDGLYMAIDHLKQARNQRKALLVISHGGDNSSKYSDAEVRQAVRESDVQIYSIGIYEPLPSGDQRPAEAGGSGLLRDLCEQTGGKNFRVGNQANLAEVAAAIGLELRNQYVLGYTPKNLVKDGTYRRVQVRVVKTERLPPLKPSFRTGYYAPTL